MEAREARVLDAYRAERKAALARLRVYRQIWPTVVPAARQNLARLRNTYWTPERVEAWHKAGRKPYLNITTSEPKLDPMNPIHECCHCGTDGPLTAYHIERMGLADEHPVLACSPTCFERWWAE